MEPPQPQPQPQGPSQRRAVPGTLGASPRLYSAVVRYITAKAPQPESYPANAFLDAFLDEIRLCQSGMSLFDAPIRAKLLTFSGSLQWLMFVECALQKNVTDLIDRAFVRGLPRDRELVNRVVRTSFGTDFNAKEALAMIAGRYLKTTADLIHFYFEDDYADGPPVEDYAPSEGHASADADDPLSEDDRADDPLSEDDRADDPLSEDDRAIS